MAQDFVGSNNINLLEPGGQFGTRIVGGKDAASPRYIFTRLSPIARLLFPEVDDALLHHLEDDGVKIEPKFYCPIIPLLLINGAQGIGTGWSTYIPPHSARDILEHIKAKLTGEKTLPSIRPWVRGFNGEIVVNEQGSGYTTFGIATVSVFNISDFP
jgi:DNA topoisomerase-2